ncbi:[FeFe] hydrogenase, group A [Ammonifex thiophilus]|uniref:Hydrogenase n=1 Tax=Ammonifex thiophilus TaxID=444093 RepID=A0A3D8P648_9THEO|nr:[FeFe] hydrogenase, group A [Ammonifex thiophilus]RDV84810.1 hydrogenase [Ammonifex thiophilus]
MEVEKLLEEALKQKEVTRRTFLKMMAGLGLAGLAGSVGGCLRQHEVAAGGEGWLPYQYDVAGTWPAHVRGRVPIDPSNPSIMRDDRKCILCGQCLEICHRVQSVYGYYELPIRDDIVCINCGQCSLACPTGAIQERDDTEKVLKALKDPNKFVVVQTAPSIRVALGEEFGMPPGTWVTGKMVAALRRLGFHAVLDTNFAADLTIMEEATELIKRIKGELPGRPLPQFTSCSPGWVKFCEYFYPDLLPHVSSCKSPQQMFGATVKTYYAEKRGIDPRKIVSVSIMPCTAKKFEAQRPEMISARKYWEKKKGPDFAKDVTRDVDIVLTTRELAKLIKQAKIDFPRLPDEDFDPLMGKCTGGAIIFGASGGVMEAAIRTAYFFITGKEPPPQLLDLKPIRGLASVKEAAVDIPGAGTIRVAVCQGMAASRQVLDIVRAGKAPWHFVEFMACPGGCESGGGQPRSSVPQANEVRAKRTASLYAADARWVWRESHENPDILKVYQDFYGHPMSELAEELLHTHYTSRADKLKAIQPSEKEKPWEQYYPARLTPEI